MTFSILGFCRRTAMTGVAITTSSIAVASRCPWARAGVGAVATQNITDPSLGPALLDLLADGLAAAEALARITGGRKHIEYRQLTVIDTQGNTAHYTGAKTLGTNAVAEGVDCVGAGNLLSTTEVPRAMVERFAADAAAHLAPRLIAALQAGLDAGGEAGPVRSAGLLVAHEQAWPLVDLRADWDEGEPITTLRSLWDTYEPQMADYTTRALNPAAAPSYGVPADE